jgi:quercetin dioxygenase-like cupin family protein
VPGIGGIGTDRAIEADVPALVLRRSYQEASAMAPPAATKTPGVKRPGAGEHHFELAKVNQVEGGPGYSTATGSCIEGDRMMVALMRMPAGTGAEPHSHPNDQWIYILDGTFEADIGGKAVTAKAGSVLYIPANLVHSGTATPDADVVFFTVKDTSHGLHGVKAA